jgi:hypothetical protein
MDCALRCLVLALVVLALPAGRAAAQNADLLRSRLDAGFDATGDGWTANRATLTTQDGTATAVATATGPFSIASEWWRVPTVPSMAHTLSLTLEAGDPRASQLWAGLAFRDSDGGGGGNRSHVRSPGRAGRRHPAYRAGPGAKPARHGVRTGHCARRRDGARRHAATPWRRRDAAGAADAAPRTDGEAVVADNYARRERDPQFPPSCPLRRRPPRRVRPPPLAWPRRAPQPPPPPRCSRRCATPGSRRGWPRGATPAAR